MSIFKMDFSKIMNVTRDRTIRTKWKFNGTRVSQEQIKVKKTSCDLEDKV